VRVDEAAVDALALDSRVDDTTTDVLAMDSRVDDATTDALAMDSRVDETGTDALAPDSRGSACRLDRRRTGDAGQAAVELVAGLPALLLLAAVVMQLLAVGYTAVLAGNAAEAGALAMARGGMPESAARSAAPGWARRGMRVRRTVGAVNVQMKPPRLVPWVGGLLRIRASAAVAAPGRVGLLP
jgi:hypothetical protein